MQEKRSSHFRMGGDGENSGHSMREEIIEDRIEKLSHRMTLISILIPVFLVVVLVLAYLDLTKRVSTFQNTEASEVQELAGNLEERFSSLSVKLAELEDRFSSQSENIKELQKQMVSADTALKKTYDQQLKSLEARFNKSIGRLGKTKTDEKDLQNALKPIQNALEPLRSDVKKLSATYRDIDEKFAKELTLINGSLADFNELLNDLTKRVEERKEDVKNLDVEFQQLKSQTISKNDLRVALDEEKEIYRQMTGLITKNLEKRLDGLREEIHRLADRMQPETEQKTAEPTSPSEEENEQAPESGKIIEKNLR